MIKVHFFRFVERIVDEEFFIVFPNEPETHNQAVPPSNSTDVFGMIFQLIHSRYVKINCLTDSKQLEPTAPVNRSAYTHRSVGTVKSKQGHQIPPGALLIAPDGEILTVGGPHGHTEGIYSFGIVHIELSR